MIEMTYKGERTEGQDMIVLPKNVRQVGEVQKDRKIYIEDYVVTYMKQKITENKNLGCILVLMGRKEYTADTMYMFVDGAFAVDYHAAGSDYVFGDKIWEDVYETIKKYFISSEMVGWLIYDDDLSEDKLLKAQRKNFPAEDMLLLKQESYEDESMYYLYREGMLQKLQGFFVYYEKNEAMQEFMVEHMRTSSAEEEKNLRQREAPVVRYRSRMRDRRARSGVSRTTGILYAVSSVLVLLVILVGISMVNNYDKMLDMRQSLEEMASTVKEQQYEENLLAEQQEYKEKQEEVPVQEGDQTGEKEMADQTQENERVNAEVEIVPAGVEVLSEEEVPETTQQSEDVIPEQETLPAAGLEEDEAAEPPSDHASSEATTSSTDTKVYYTVELGDTLMGICKEVYGDPGMVKKLCEVNGIEDGDKIQAGQKILLP